MRPTAATRWLRAGLIAAACAWMLPAAAAPAAAPDQAADRTDAAAAGLPERMDELRQMAQQQGDRALLEIDRLKAIEAGEIRQSVHQALEAELAGLEQARQAAREQADRAREQALASLDADQLERSLQLALLDGPAGLHGASRSAARKPVDEGAEGGGNSVDERRPLNADGRVYVNDVSGSVVVTPWDKNEVYVTGQLGGGVDHLEIGGDASALNIVVKLPRHTHMSGSADLHLMVPAKAGVTVETVSADVAVQGTRGAVKVTTVSGDVGLTLDGPEVAVQTVSGDLILHGPVSSTAASSVSGDLRMNGLQGKLLAETVSGHVELAGGKFSEMRLKSISGDMRLDVSFADHASVTGETLSGDINLLVPADVSGTAILKSFSGEAQCNAKQVAASSGIPGKKHEREYTFGDGKGVSLSLSTFSGDIHVDKK